MKKLNKRTILYTLLAALCTTCATNLAIADSDGQPSIKGKDLIQKYLGAVQAKIQSNWKPNIDKNAQTVCPTVRFTILPDGQVADVQIARSSNNQDIDSSAITAVKTASPFPTINVPPYNKDGLPIEMDFSLNVFMSADEKEKSISDVISQAHQKFDKGDWQSAASILNAGLTKYSDSARLKNSLSAICANQAGLLIEKSPLSPDGLELAKKALSLDPNNGAAKQFMPAAWTILDYPELAFSIKFPDHVKRTDSWGLFGKMDNWVAPYNDCFYSVGVCKFNDLTHLAMKSLSGQQPTLQGMVKGFFANLQSSSGCTVESKNLVKEYKINEYLASDYSFSLSCSDGKSILDGKSVFCVNENFGYVFSAICPQGKLKQADPFFLSIKINSSAIPSGLSTEDDNDLLQGNTALKRGDYDKAVSEFSKVIEQHPHYAHYAKPYFRRAMAYENLKQYQKAIDDLTMGIKLDPDNASAYSGRGIIYWQLGKPEKAIDDCSRAIQLNPKGVAGYANRCIIYCKLKQYQKAIDDCSKAIELDSKLGGLYSNRAAAYFGLGQYQKAIDDCTKAIALNPKLASAYTIRGEAFFKTKQYQKTVEDCSAATLLAPTMSKAYHFRAEAYKAMGKNDLAEKDSQTAQKSGRDETPVQP